MQGEQSFRNRRELPSELLVFELIFGALQVQNQEVLSLGQLRVSTAAKSFRVSTAAMDCRLRSFWQPVSFSTTFQYEDNKALRLIQVRGKL